MSVVKLLVLGALKRRAQAHGYRIHQDLKEWHIETWTSVRPGSIYHAMSQLEAENSIKAVKSTDAPKLGPAKAEFGLTASGEQVFMESLAESLKDINLIEFSAGIAFMEYLPRQRVLQLLHERVKAQHRVTSFLETLPTEALPTTPAKHPELIRVWSESYRHAVTSTLELINSIQSGNYVFQKERTRNEKPNSYLT